MQKFCLNIFSFRFNVWLTTMPWFYAVARGRKTGVYSTWAECQKEVLNIQNAKYRKFSTEEEAWEFVNNATPMKSPVKVISPVARNTSPSLLSNMQYASTSQMVSCSQSAALSITTLQQRQAQLEKRNVELGERIGRELQEMRTKLETLNTTVKKLASGMCGEIGQVLENVTNLQTYFNSSRDEMKTEISQLSKNVQSFVTKGEIPAITRGENLSHAKRNLSQMLNAVLPEKQSKRHFSNTRTCSSEFPDSPDGDEIVELEVPPKKIVKIELEADTESYDFQYDADGCVVVFTDGACENNGKRGAKAGIGVWFGHNHPLNSAEPVQGRATNNTAEIQAAVHAIEVAKKAGVKKLSLNTDSEFMINCMTKWIHRWKKNNWTTTNHQPVKNKEDLVHLDDAMQGIHVKWNHVRGHCGILGNEMADSLARSGAMRYMPSQNSHR